MSKISILVTGASGQVGREIAALAPDFPDFDFVFADSQQLNVSSHDDIQRMFASRKFDYCINTAAYTAVDKAETDREKVALANMIGPHLLARACKESQTRLIHLSTDYVYHNTLNRPLLEDDPVEPKSVYAFSKCAGDEAVLHFHPEGAMVVRTSWVFSSFGHNFVKTMLRLGKERPELRVVCDQIGTPTYARHLALALLRAIASAESGAIDRDLLRGIYHFSNEGVASWYDFALAIFEMSGLSCVVLPIETSEYPTPARRPPYSVLNKTKWKMTFGQSIPHWREGLRECLEVMTPESGQIIRPI
jgi:dTDP-4-dehydrorhamnose reductase